MKHTTVVWSLLVGCLLLFAGRVEAQSADVAVGGELLFRIRAAAEGKTAQQRADQVTERLPDILGDSNLQASDITLTPDTGGKYKILVKQRLLVTVTPEDGKVNGITAQKQAAIWLAQIQKILPLVNAQPNPNLIGQAPQTISGTVAYRERIALPPNTVAVVRLLDVSRADAPAKVIVQKRITMKGQVPVPFSLTYPLGAIKDSSTYAVDAQLLINGKLRWTSTDRYAVITQGNPRQVAIIVHPVQNPKP